MSGNGRGSFDTDINTVYRPLCLDKFAYFCRYSKETFRGDGSFEMHIFKSMG